MTKLLNLLKWGLITTGLGMCLVSPPLFWPFFCLLLWLTLLVYVVRWVRSLPSEKQILEDIIANGVRKGLQK
jgi:hypothetical protein